MIISLIIFLHKLLFNYCYIPVSGHLFFSWVEFVLVVCCVSYRSLICWLLVLMFDPWFGLGMIPVLVSMQPLP